MENKTCRYLDGSGNEYIINYKPEITIEFIPVKPLQSSSGIYNGGDYIKKEITIPQYNKIISTLMKAIGNKDIYITERVKGSGVIISQKENKKMVYILEPGSKEINIIEKNLQEIIQN